MLIVQGMFGVIVLTAFAWAISENRRAVPWRITISGVILMVVMAALLLKVPLFKQFFFSLNEGLAMASLRALQKASNL
jgi:CNT family concentrative nucleoside transporter